MAALRLEIRLQRLESPVVRGRQEMRGRLGTRLLGNFGPYLKSSGNPLKNSYQVFPLKDDLGCCDRKDWRAPQWMQGEQLGSHSAPGSCLLSREATAMPSLPPMDFSSKTPFALPSPSPFYLRTTHSAVKVLLRCHLIREACLSPPDSSQLQCSSQRFSYCVVIVGQHACHSH